MVPLENTSEHEAGQALGDLVILPQNKEHLCVVVCGGGLLYCDRAFF